MTTPPTHAPAPRHEATAETAARLRQLAASLMDIEDDDVPGPWWATFDPPMVWDARGDAIVSQMPDGRPYFDDAVAAYLVAVNPAALLALLAVPASPAPSADVPPAQDDELAALATRLATAQAGKSTTAQEALWFVLYVPALLSRVTAAEREVARLRGAVWRTVELPNELRFQMGTTFGSTRQDEAYAEGWNDLRTALGRALTENADAALYATAHPGGAGVAGGE